MKPFVLCSLSAVLILMGGGPRAADIVLNETSFVPLLSGGGAEWRGKETTLLALHPGRNRLYSVALAADARYRVIHRDTVTNGVVASSTTSLSWDPVWEPYDLGVWANGDEVLVQWAEFMGGARTRGLALERIDLKTGFSRSVNPSVRFVAFGVDQARDSAWGIAEDQAREYFNVVSLDLASNVVSATEIPIAVPEAILKDVVVDATNQILYGLFQPTYYPGGSPDFPRGGAFVMAYSLPGVVFQGRAEIPDHHFGPGGAALDAERGVLYALAFEPGGALYRIDVAAMVLDASFEEQEIAIGYQAGGAIAVHKPSGHVFITNNSERSIASRVLRVNLEAEPIEVVGRWPAGADPSYLLYDPRLDQVYAGSYYSQSVTVITASVSRQAIQSPMVIKPWDLVFEPGHQRLLLLSEAGEIYAVESRTARLTDRIDSFGLRSKVGIELDLPRGRFFAGSFDQSPPLVFDSGTLIQVDQLDSGGRGMAVSQNDGLLFQPNDAGQIYIRSATDGTLRSLIPAEKRFQLSHDVALDDERKWLYGLTLRSGGDDVPGLWYFNWITGASGDLHLPISPRGPWTSFRRIEVEPSAGTIAVIGKSIDYHLILYESYSDSAPALVTLSGLTSANDLLIDSVHRFAMVLGAEGFFERARLFWVNLRDAPLLRSALLDLVSPPERMALDDPQGILWLASRKPSGLYQIPWPPTTHLHKTTAVQAAVSVEVEARPGRNRIQWNIEPPPLAGFGISILRQDGDLAAFRSLLPAPLPEVATEYTDVDVVPGIAYRYRVQVETAQELFGGESEFVVAQPGTTHTILSRPLTLLQHIPAGSTESIDVTLEGQFKLLRLASANLDESLGGRPSGLHIDISPQTIPVPGIFRLKIRVDENVPPGLYPIPVRVLTKDESSAFWVFAQVSSPFGDSIVQAPPYPARSRQLGIHTDSRLREKSDNLLVMKGELGALAGDARGTGVIARIDLGDGRVMEQRDQVAEGNRFSTSVRLPDLVLNTIIRAQVTWLGSSTSPGGTSPILRLPVGAYSENTAGKSATAQPEAAIFIRGETPTLPAPPPTSQDLDNIVEDAESTLLKDFTGAGRSILRDKDAILQALSGQPVFDTLFLYAVADTAGGTIYLSDGNSLSAEELRDWFGGMPGYTTAILMVEGPRSGAFAAPGIGYRDDLTVMSSCHEDELNNRMTPWRNSFSSRFFYKCRQGRTLAECFQAANLTFLDRFAGQLQSPQIFGDQAANAVLASRFFPALLPDLTPPEILQIQSGLVSEQPRAIQVSAFVSDNRDAAVDLGMFGWVFSVDHPALQPLEFTPPEDSNSPHTARLWDVTMPGAGLILSATDGAGNVSPQLAFWLSYSEDGLPFDVDGSGEVEQKDLIKLQRMDRLNFVDDQWLLEFARHWMEEFPD